MTTIKLGKKNFDVLCTKIDAVDCGVTVADCAAFGARMIAGEFRRLNTLKLVSFVQFKHVFLVLVCYEADVSGAGGQRVR